MQITSFSDLGGGLLIDTPLDRDPPDKRSPWTETPWTETLLEGTWNQGQRSP